MDISMMLAQVIGISLIVVYLGVLLNQKLVHSYLVSVREHPILMFISGFIALVLGLLVIQVHNFWEANWTVIITIFGWALFIGGAYRILFPVFALKVARKISSMPHNAFTAVCVAFCVLGLFLTYMSCCG